MDPLTLDVYAGRRAAEVSLYEDDGVSLEYRKGRFARTKIPFEPSAEAGSYALTIGASHGDFNGRLKQRRYVVRIHGLLKPDSVEVNGVKLAAPAEDQSGTRWTWDDEHRVTVIHLPKPASTAKPLLVVIAGAATFEDTVVLQKALNLRAQVRQAKRLMKLKLSQLLGDLDISKQPRVIRRTEEVERELTALIHNPRGIGSRPLDFGALRQKVVDALRDKPFECDRTIPDLDPVPIVATKQVEGGMFTSWYQAGEASEEAKILACLRGAELPAWLFNPR